MIGRFLSNTVAKQQYIAESNAVQAQSKAKTTRKGRLSTMWQVFLFSFFFFGFGPWLFFFPRLTCQDTVSGTSKLCRARIRALLLWPQQCAQRKQMKQRVRTLYCRWTVTCLQKTHQFLVPEIEPETTPIKHTLKALAQAPKRRPFGGVVNKAQPQPTTAKGLFRTRPRPGFAVVGQH